MESSILEAINYVSRVSKQKVTIDSISSFLNSREATNLDNVSITTLLKEMQADGLINKHNRSINTDTTLRTPNPPQLEICTVPENQESQNNDNSINNSSVSMMHRSIAIPMNRTLPPTPSAGSNITPINTERLLSVNSPSLNTKLESLESKLCEKIMAMKSFFIDELQSLKNNKPTFQIRDFSGKIEEKIAMENKIKLLETENKLLKDDLSNKQKIIDTILMHNSKLIESQNSIHLNENDTRKKLADHQHHVYQDLSDRHNTKEKQRHVENKSPQNKDIKHPKVTNSQGNKLLTDKKKSNIYILGDSMVKHIEGWKLTKKTDKNHKIYVRSFPGAKVKFMKDYAKPCIRENDPDHVILHVGTNELNSELLPERIAKSIVDVAKNIKSEKRSVSISGVVPRNDDLNNKASEVNKELSRMCKKEKLPFLEHSNINPRAHLNKSRIHLNRNGSEKLGKNFVDFVVNHYA